MTLGTPPGINRKATIIRYSNDGTVSIKLNEGESYAPVTPIKVPIPAAWAGPQGQFIGGYPERGSTVIVEQGAGGQWQIVSFINSDGVFDDIYVSGGSTHMDELQPGRALIQVKDQTHIYLDPKEGMVAGRADNYLQVNPIDNIISHNLETEMSFTEGSRKIDGPIKRDLVVNVNRNVFGSTLDSQAYDKSLTTVGMDPRTIIGIDTIGTNIRNPSLVENREVVYEFANTFDFQTDLEESIKYSGNPQLEEAPPTVNRRNMRTDAFSLSLEYPNHLIESVAGTAVDTFGNILDLNRSILPVGRTSELNLKSSKNKEDTFVEIRRLHRRAIAYHWELNARKDLIEPRNRVGVETTDRGTPDVNSTKDYSRDRSRFFIDIDKEGQFKINVPASSETGNIPLLARYENYSVIAAAQNPNEINPNSFVRSDDSQEIYLDGFSSSDTSASPEVKAASIELSGGNTNIEGFAAPIDNTTDEPLKYGTAYHNIREVCSEFQTAKILTSGAPLVSFDSTIPANNPEIVAPLESIVSDTITVFGDEANAGGRSGSINLDGFLQLNMGANTIDRHSLHYDFAGGVIGRVGRDKQGISYAASLDGDMFLQIGGDGLPSTLDSRFADDNVTRRNGSLDIRVYVNGQMAMLRIGANSDGSAGIDLISPGNVSIFSAKDITLKSNSNVNIEAEFINMYAGTEKRLINRFPNNTIG